MTSYTDFVFCSWSVSVLVHDNPLLLVKSSQIPTFTRRIFVRHYCCIEIVFMPWKKFDYHIWRGEIQTTQNKTKYWRSWFSTKCLYPNWNFGTLACNMTPQVCTQWNSWLSLLDACNAEHILPHCNTFVDSFYLGRPNSVTAAYV